MFQKIPKFKPFFRSIFRSTISPNLETLRKILATSLVKTEGQKQLSVSQRESIVFWMCCLAEKCPDDNACCSLMDTLFNLMFNLNLR